MRTDKSAGGINMQIAEQSVDGAGDVQQARAYFREVSERCKLPPLPAIVASALRMVRDPM